MDEKRARLYELSNLSLVNTFNKDLYIEMSRLTTLISRVENIESSLSELQILFELTVEESDELNFNEVSKTSDELLRMLESFELELMFDQDDENNAIVSINSGSGGLEAQDWARMLFRMYQKWCEKHGYGLKLLNLIRNDQDGIKNIDFLVSGKHAYGYLKVETGVHRLVRNSPFDSNNSRHTSFASVFVSPEINDKIEIVVNDSDIRIDKFCASGSGGQHVNKTESAIRITHFPSKIVVSCQNEKSQHTNLEIAMRILKSKLYELELQKKQEKIQELHDNMSDISWGNQIRSYFLQPNVIIKDHRSNVESFDANKVLGGEIDQFIKPILLMGIKK